MTLRTLLRGGLFKSGDDHSVNVIVWRKVCVPRLHVTSTLGDCVKSPRRATNHLETHRFTSSLMSPLGSIPTECRYGRSSWGVRIRFESPTRKQPNAALGVGQLQLWESDALGCCR